MSDEKVPLEAAGISAATIIDYTRVLQSKGGEWYVLGYSSNGEVIVRSSETYENESHARKVAEELGPIKEDKPWGDVGRQVLDVGSD